MYTNVCFFLSLVFLCLKNFLLNLKICVPYITQYVKVMNIDKDIYLFYLYWTFIYFLVFKS